MKSIIVTGAYGGMGKAVVNKLVSCGYNVFALDLKTESATPNVTPIQVDLTNQNSLDLAFKTIASIENEIFAIVHLAGIYKLNSLVEIKEEEFNVKETNL